MTFKCFHCGFQTKDKGDFLATQGDGKHYWQAFICPQCSLANPPVAEAGSLAFKEPVWGFEESDYGLAVWLETEDGGKVISPIIRKHHLADAPAALLHRGMEGTVWDLHLRLAAQGRAKSESFKGLVEKIREQFPTVLSDAQREQYQTALDEARKVKRVGPYSERVSYQMRA